MMGADGDDKETNADFQLLLSFIIGIMLRKQI
uniref:Uncharacterized protein n=1 Tax=Anguilla anguilla TaxID=7936 RepID=A0A0E9PL68_ANGAN